MPADVLFLLSSHCPHCPAVLAGLADLLKHGEIGRLEAINIELHPESARALGVRSVPWTRIGPFELTGALTVAELTTWASRADTPDGMADAFHDLLKQGGLARVRALIEAEPGRLAALLAIVANPEASLNVRLGVGVLIEEYAGTPTLAALLPELTGLSADADARVRADACHYLGLTGAPDARAPLAGRLDDDDADVREIAQESLDALAARGAAA